MGPVLKEVLVRGKLTKRPETTRNYKWIVINKITGPRSFCKVSGIYFLLSAFLASSFSFISQLRWRARSTELELEESK
jgi:hypothetical protein